MRPDHIGQKQPGRLARRRAAQDLWSRRSAASKRNGDKRAMRPEVSEVGLEFFGVAFSTLSSTLLAAQSSDQRSQLAAPVGRSRSLPRPAAKPLTTLISRDSTIGNPRTD